MIIQGKDLRDLSSNRIPLKDAIPLDTPFVVYIEPTNSCNLRCSFCPTGNPDVLAKVNRPSGTMKWELFLKVVNELSKFPQQLRRVQLYKDGEPLINKKFSRMVKELKSSGVTKEVWTKSNGLLLSPLKNRELVFCGLDMIGISVKHVSAEGYKKTSGVLIDFDKFVANISDLFTLRNDTVSKLKIYISIADSGLTEDEIQTFYEIFAPISDYCAVEHLHGWSMSGIKDFTLGIKSDTFDGLPLIPKIVCPWPFYTFTVNFNGQITVCNEDFAYTTVIGDVNTESLINIWNGDRFFEFRKMLLEGRRSENQSCENCYYLQCLPDRIDDERFELLKRMEDARK
jgi:radical SAM protein with 4Fe4S-binding SPASM domain